MNQEAYKNHWDNIFLNKDTSKVSWYQDKPGTSLRLIHNYADNKSISIIDVGGGDSRLPDFLVDLQYKRISVLDISNKALEVTKSRMGTSAKNVVWIETNVLDFKPRRKFDIWHDRAVFHFINDIQDQLKYKRVVLDSITKKGVVIIATSSKNDGPVKCSGLDVNQHDQHSITKLLYPEFELLDTFDNTHQTPSGDNQNFNWVVLKRIK